VDVAFKVVGTGSVGLRDYCIYFEGNDPRIRSFCKSRKRRLQLRALSARCPPATHNGQRTWRPTRHAGAIRPISGLDAHWRASFLVRQLNDHKGSIELEDMAGGALTAFGQVCGSCWPGHARSGDPLVIAGYLGSGSSFAEALGRFGSLYADQTEKDWQALRRSGKVGAKS